LDQQTKGESQMWTSQELKNFGRYLAITPKHALGKVNPPGAYDARGGARDHGFDHRLNRSHFSKGGAFAHDEGERGQGRDTVLAAMSHLAAKLSVQDWAQFQQVLCGGETAEDDEPEVTGRPEGSEAMDRLPAKLRQRVETAAADERRGAARSFSEMYPESRPITTVSGSSPRALF
jgi:hypothetical protein